MRKSWRAVYQRFRPDYVVFLGDMMDNGRLDMSHDEYVDQLRSFPTSYSRSRYERYYQRFLSAFPAPKDKVYYVAGNHDVGCASLCPQLLIVV
jgi:predicted phosphodiesterase